MPQRIGRLTFVLIVLAMAGGTGVSAAELQPQTVAGFERYVRATELQTGATEPFLHLDRLAAGDRRTALETVRRGGLFIESRTTRDAGRSIDVPGGMIHHWLGVVFVPGATVDEAVALLSDYDRHADIYGPNVARSKLLSRQGDVFRVALRFRMAKVLTVVVDSEHEARFMRMSADRAQSWIQSRRIAEVDNPDTPDEREKPVGNDGGYLWRLNTYWRVLERDGGTYVQCEAISLTRTIPSGLAWLVGPFVSSIPRESLTFTLETTRRALTRARASRLTSHIPQS
jgi:hypothetical protein